MYYINNELITNSLQIRGEICSISFQFKKYSVEKRFQHHIKSHLAAKIAI